MRSPVVEPLNEYAPPKAENLKPLGSLAQSARGKEIKQAQVILIIIGLLTMAVNGFLLFNLPNEIRQAIQQNQIDPAEVAAFTQAVNVIGYLIYGGALLLGAVFFIFGLIVKQYPVPITITSLVLYILATLGFGLLNPASLAQGIIVKILFIVGLFRAVKAARAYEGHTQKATTPGEVLA
jgi:hypothetical protein